MQKNKGLYVAVFFLIFQNALSQLYSFDAAVEISFSANSYSAKEISCFYNTSNRDYCFEFKGDNKSSFKSVSLVDRKLNAYIRFVELDKIDLDNLAALSVAKFKWSKLVSRLYSSATDEEYLKKYAESFTQNYSRSFEIIKGNSGVDTLKVLTVPKHQKKRPKSGFKGVFTFKRSDVDNWSVIDGYMSHNISQYLPLNLPYPIEVLTFEVISFAMKLKDVGTVKTTKINQQITIDKKNKVN
jgi:hypothetical protein